MSKKTKVYPRSRTIEIKPTYTGVIDGLVLDYNNHKIFGLRDREIFPLLGETKLQCNRERSNPKNGGKKLLHQSISPTDDIWFNPTLQTLSYNHLIAVDTNTNFFNNSKVSITAAYHLIPQSFDYESAWCVGGIIALFEMWNITQKAENLGWWQVLRMITEPPNKLSGKIGLIVDSDLDNHDDYNARKKPIVADYYLPKNVTLIYGSDKGGAEHLSTKLIKYCHNLGADLYKNELLLMNISNLHRGSPGLYSHFRQWNTASMKVREFVKPENIGSN